MNLRFQIRLIVFGLLLVFGSGALAATENQGKRVALVIGNGKYEHANKLPNPPKDAADMGRKLTGLGFDVVLGVDLNMADFGKTLREFSKRVEGADVALLFYAGHGLQVDGTNFLIPTDAKIEASSDLDFQAVKLDSLITLMDRSAKLSLIFLDACRNNPLARSLTTRGISSPGGLAPQSIASGSYIAFATAPGNVAYDGGKDEKNSPFTTALLENIGRENVDIRLMMADVRAEVFNVTGEKQLPWENNSLIGRFYFRTGKNVEVDAVARQASLVERDAFDRARKIGTVAALKEFLAANPDGLFSGIAHDTIASLEGSDSETTTSIDDVFWRTVRDSVLPADFQLYLDIFEKGKFRDLAQARITSLDHASSIKNYVLEDGTTLDSRASIRQVALAKVDQLPVMFVQYGLIALGFPIAEPSGILDPETRKAIRGYQASLGATQTGQLTSRETVEVILAAAAIGDDHAETAVGIMTASGIGLDHDDQVARMWLSRASDSGNKYAQANLAVLLRDGRGGNKDVERARSLLKLAVDQGLPDAEPLLRDLGG